jgi:geranylgeranyl diphosphate synthase, type II
MSNHKELSEEVATALEIFSKHMHGEPRELYEPIQYMLQLGGKRMRPLLVLLGCELFDGKVTEAVPAALAVEVFHNFTLVHDDIMDNAPLRRNKPTVHEKWNTNIALLSGDAMLVKAYQLLAQYPSSLIGELLPVFNKTALEVCEGQQLDMNFEKVFKVKIQEYIHMISLKTAVLLAASLKMGALIGGAREEDAQRLYNFGKNIGIAFQLQDDILDVYGVPEKFGKQVGGDIIANKKTYLLLKAFELADQYTAEALSNWVFAPEFDPGEKVKAVTEIYDYLQVKELARTEMLHYYDKGLSELTHVPVNEARKKTLIAFADQLMVREL